MSRLVISSAVFVLILVLSASFGYGQGQGRGQGRIPTLPPQATGPGQFPGFPDNAGTGQPEIPGPPSIVPESNEHANHDGPGIDLQSATATEQLDRTPVLAGRLAGMLGVDEAGLSEAADGYSALGPFVAAVNVSAHVEGTTFDGLKMRMLGDDTTEPMSLGEAIADEAGIEPAAAEELAAQAQDDAEELIDETS